MKAREIADLVGGELHGDGDIEIESVADLASASASQIAFLDKGVEISETEAGCVIVASDFPDPASPPPSSITVQDPKLAFSLAAAVLHPQKQRAAKVHPSAVISRSAKIAEGVFVGAYVCIGDNAVIGKNTQLRAGSKIGDRVRVGSKCVIHPNVFVEDGCSIGDRVILHSGVVIGADGFGFVRDASGNYNKFPQIGTVVINDDVEIGANTCVDRAALGETHIGAGTKIDNLVQIGHNVRIGQRCVIAAQTGISGSTVIEDDCVIGGQVGFGDHAIVKSGAVIGSQAGVLPGKIVRPGVWWGTPIQPLDEYKRQNAHLKGIGRLKEEVRRLRSRLDSISDDENE